MSMFDAVIWLLGLEDGRVGATGRGDRDFVQRDFEAADVEEFDAATVLGPVANVDGAWEAHLLRESIDAVLDQEIDFLRVELDELTALVVPENADKGILDNPCPAHPKAENFTLDERETLMAEYAEAARLLNLLQSQVEKRGDSHSLPRRDTVPIVKSIHPVHPLEHLWRLDLLDGRNETWMCPGVIFVWARGSGEQGTMGSVGPHITRRLETEFARERAWIHGVGDPYKASHLANVFPEGTQIRAIKSVVKLFEIAQDKCPDARLVAGGFSQGAALISKAVTMAKPTVRDNIEAVVLFGNTKAHENNGTIKDYPTDRLQSYCNARDAVCRGVLLPMPDHGRYHRLAGTKASDFLIQRLRVVMN